MKSSILILFTLLSKISIAQCEEFIVELSYTDPVCPDYADGSVTAVPSGGSMPYLILITDADGTVHNTDGGSETGNYLLEGWYYIFISDDAGCTFEDSLQLIDPLQINVEDYTVIEPTELDVCDGSITINEVSGDYANLFYAWTPDPDDISGIDANSMTDACAGTYDLTILNEVGCSMSYVFEIGLALSIANKEFGQIYINNTLTGIQVNVEVQTYEQLSFQITDLKGVTIMNTNLQNGDNLIEFDNHGVFIVTIIDNNGEIYFTKKYAR